MAKRYPRLTIRNHTYYLRVAIPKEIESVALRKEIVYSLHTKDYYTAIKKYPKESTAVDMLFEFLKVIKVRINKENGFPYDVKLEDNYIDYLMVHRLEEIQRFCEKEFKKIACREKTYDDVSIEKRFLINAPENTKNTRNQKWFEEDDEFKLDITYAAQYLYHYLQWLAKQEETHITIKEMIINKIFGGETNFPIPTDSFKYEKLKDKNTSIHKTKLKSRTI